MDKVKKQTFKKSRHQVGKEYLSITDFCRKNGVVRETISRKLKRLNVSMEEFLNSNKDGIKDAILTIFSKNIKTVRIEIKFSAGMIYITKGKAGLQISTVRTVLKQIDEKSDVEEVLKNICSCAAQIYGVDDLAIHEEFDAMNVASVTAEPKGLLVYRIKKI